jgi:hypothetical protein
MTGLSTTAPPDVARAAETGVLNCRNPRKGYGELVAVQDLRASTAARTSVTSVQRPQRRPGPRRARRARGCRAACGGS